MSVPAVSIVMAIKNAARYLRAALDSIAAQTMRDYEVIIVDGCSTDGGLDIARSYSGIICLAQAKSGFADAWNQGISAARAPFIGFLDADDVWLPNKLARQLRLFESKPDARYVIGRVQFFSEPGVTLPPGFKRSLLDGTHVAFMPGTSLIRRDVFDDLGLFEERWAIASDIEWYHRLRQSGMPFAVLDEAVLRKRVHSHNLSYVTEGALYRSELLRVLKESVQRHRGA